MANVLEIRNVGRLRVLRLNRPERKNALNGDLFGALFAAFREAAEDDGVWAIVLTGNGDAFCSGLDLAESNDQSEEAPHEERETEREHLSIAMRVRCEKPIVAGINGVAVGIGCSLAMNADIRIAAPSARFHPGYARVATSPDGGLTWTLVRAVGYERAMRFLLEQRMVSASEALTSGLVSEVCDSDEGLEARWLEYGGMLAEVAPIAARQTKRLLNRIDQPLDMWEHVELEMELALRGLGSKDSAEAIRAMGARDRPQFTGE